MKKSRNKTQQALEIEPQILKLMFAEIDRGLKIIQKQISEDPRSQACKIYDEMWGEGLVRRVEKKCLKMRVLQANPIKFF